LYYAGLLMKRTRKEVVRDTAWLAAVFCAAASVSILSLPAWTAESSDDQARTRPTRSDENPLVKPGEFAPDFELPRLTFEANAAGKPVGVISEKDTIRLSSFRGKKPVCLIMSSYT
jgi:hypothetical protein